VEVGRSRDWMYNEMEMKSFVTCFQNAERKNIVMAIRETAARNQS
jgi:hypothetical protein